MLALATLGQPMTLQESGRRSSHRLCMAHCARRQAMNRRDALKSLLAAPPLAGVISKVESLDLGPNDILVLTAEQPITAEIAERIREHAKAHLDIPNKIIVVEGLKVSVVRQ
jgi:hypothetical protein